MALRKLSDSDKSDIIELYKQPNQTTSTLAEQYGVSNSTVSRILKTTLPPEEYSALISQKRMAGSDKTEAVQKSVSQKSPSQKKQSQAAADKDTPLRKQAAAPDAPATELIALKSTTDKSAEDKSAADQPNVDRPKKIGAPKLKTAAEKDEQLALLTSDTDEEISPDDDDDDDDDDLLGLDETLGDDFGDDDDEEEEDDDDDDDDVTLHQPKRSSAVVVEIMPLAEAVLPKPCYLVIDMRSELITRPLSDFADLGQVPSDEEKSKTLPVFDNHRVARRFSRNKQRVIKVPDGSLITRTSPY
ncbi:MAG: hypothetical protein WBA76_14080, partial [Phormidesmis sp.]